MIRSVTIIGSTWTPCASDPTLAVEYWGYDDLEGLSFGWDGDLEECYRAYSACNMTEGR